MVAARPRDAIKAANPREEDGAEMEALTSAWDNFSTRARKPWYSAFISRLCISRSATVSNIASLAVANVAGIAGRAIGVAGTCTNLDMAFAASLESTASAFSVPKKRRREIVLSAMASNWW
jgi:hypothetical protein